MSKLETVERNQGVHGISSSSDPATVAELIATARRAMAEFSLKSAPTARPASRGCNRIAWSILARQCAPLAEIAVP